MRYSKTYLRIAYKRISYSNHSCVEILTASLTYSDDVAGKGCLC